MTAGEPAGIGPDLVVRLAQERLAGGIVAVADPDLLLERAALLGLPLRVIPFEARAAIRLQAGCPVSFGSSRCPCAYRSPVGV